MPVTITNVAEVIDNICGNIKNKKSAYVAISNVHMCMEAFDSMVFASRVSRAGIIVPDGRPLYWALKILGYSNANQIRGQDLFNELCQVAESKKYKIGLYGGSSVDVLDSVISKLKVDYPLLEVSYAYSPPFKSLSTIELQNIFDQINTADVDILFVGIGCPKQENWMSEAHTKVNATMLGVGAVFDFVSGAKNHAPLWMQRAGLEWLFRLFSEPKRLWKRYLKQNPRFIYYFLQQWLFKKDFTKEGPKNV
jgi:N-acetylglucosaminyldiphosphoundecaprenol N-acetyl-beta-D-mannosaminyltransferase